MFVEVFIKIFECFFLNYLIKLFVDYFNKVFCEDWGGFWLRELGGVVDVCGFLWIVWLECMFYKCKYDGDLY